MKVEGRELFFTIFEARTRIHSVRPVTEFELSIGDKTDIPKCSPAWKGDHGLIF